MVPALGQAGLETPFDDAPAEGVGAGEEDLADGVRDAEGVAEPEAGDGDVVLADVLRDGVMAIVET